MEKKSKFSEFLTKFGDVRLAQIWSLLKKPFNFCWKSGLIIFGICMLLAAYVWIKQAAGCVYYDSMDEPLSEDVEIRYFSNNRCATYDSVTGKRLSPKLLWISACPQRDSLTVFCDKHGRRGFLNVNTGKVVIEGQYRHAWHFSEGLAAVVGDNGKVGFINYDNEVVIPAVYDYVPSHDYVFVNGICVIPSADSDKYGAIDTLGVLKLPIEYTGIYKLYADESTWYVRKDGKYGLVDSDMNVIFETVYQNMSVNPYEDTAYLTKDGVKQLVSLEGEVLEPFVIDESWTLEYSIYDESGYTTLSHPYLLEVMVDYGCRGVMDSRTGRMVIPAIYSDIIMVSKDLLMAQLDASEEHNILFDMNGNQVEY